MTTKKSDDEIQHLFSSISTHIEERKGQTLFNSHLITRHLLSFLYGLALLRHTKRNGQSRIYVPFSFEGRRRQRKKMSKF